ncbi:hypothetical protein L3Q82_021605 [Xyrichtys novacula]|uniref:Uncharacterized protein n=1 Tax=Xyrichtys novacula TaxID=13765 RepID=A0AAV1GCK1_XYRNO|nr:hypothetical protein L3Q82_021605 [Xyrichtys novacula]
MSVNITCVPGNNSTACRTHASSAGLAAGLTVFFLVLVIAACWVIYKFRSKIRNIIPLERRRSVKKEEYIETPQADSHPYTSTATDQPTGQTPIYENLGTRAKKPSKPSRSSREPEEDLYLQCDIPDDVIYSNDPACNLSLMPDPQEDDVYIMPDVE